MVDSACTENQFEDARVEYERASTNLDLEPITSEDEDYESAPPEYQIATYPADYTLEVLYQKWRANDIQIPDFQRGFVWKHVPASKLIESFLVGLPVPAVFLYNEHKSQRYFVIDGQQRLRSVFYFFEGFFGLPVRDQRQVFTLKGLDGASRFHEKGFADLTEADQRRLKNAVLRAFIVQQMDPNDDTSMYHIFERLNTGGTLLANQEIRNCVYHGRFVEFLEDINRYESWRSILGNQEPDRRRKDMELLVRFFAMRDLTAYAKPMKDFLSKFMRKNKNPTEEVLESSRELFDRTCKAVVKTLGEKPFHVRAGLNSAVFDSVMVAFSGYVDEAGDDVAQRYRRLIENEEFDQCTRQGTTDIDIVQTRFRKASQVLFGE